MKKSRTSIFLLIAVLAVGGGVAVFASTRDVPDEIPADTVNSAVNSSGQLNVSSGSADSVAAATQEYIDTEFGFSLEYPSDWKATHNESGSGETRIVNHVFQKDGEGITLVVVPTSLEGIIRESVSIEKEEAVVIHGQDASKITAKQANDGTRLTLLIFTKNDSVFALNGAEEAVDRIGATFKFNGN